MALNDCTTSVTHTVIENYADIENDEVTNGLIHNDIPNETTILVHNDSQNVHNHTFRFHVDEKYYEEEDKYEDCSIIPESFVRQQQ